MTTVFWVIVGVFIGWNIEQPLYAKTFQEMVKTKWVEFRNKNPKNPK